MLKSCRRRRQADSLKLRNRFKNAYAQIDVQLKRRYDLIPNLVETAKGYLKHERGTLEAVIAAVIAARNAAASANTGAAANPGDPAVCEGGRKLNMAMPDSRSKVIHACFVTGIAFGLNYVWETIQCRFFIHLEGKATAAAMVIATLGDVAMTWFVQCVVAIVSRRWLWVLARWRWPQWALLLGTALVLSFLIEHWALATGRWAYTDINPRIPGTAISALPVTQLVLLFPLTFWLVRALLRSVEKLGERAKTNRSSP